MANQYPLVFQDEITNFPQGDSLIVPGSLSVRNVTPTISLESGLGISGGGNGWSVLANISEESDYGLQIRQWDKTTESFNTRLQLTETDITYNGVPLVTSDALDNLVIDGGTY